MYFSLLQISICVRWVYVEKGTTCYVKAYNGNPRNASDPLTPDDKEEFAGKINLRAYFTYLLIIFSNLNYLLLF